MTDTLLEKARQFLFGRQYAYKKTFAGPVAKDVLKDLALFCRANESTFHANDRVQSKFDGRREVWLRIQQHLNLSPEDLWRLLDGRGE